MNIGYFAILLCVFMVIEFINEKNKLNALIKKNEIELKRISSILENKYVERNCINCHGTGVIHSEKVDTVCNTCFGTGRTVIR